MVSPAADFDRIALVYDAMKRIVFGRSLERAQAVFLNRIPPGASVLIVGGGTGWLLQTLLTTNPPSRIVYLEASARMLARASRRMLSRPLLGTVEFRLGNETGLRPDEQFDVIITPFVLDLFTEETLRARFIPHLCRILKPGGQWLVTDFVPAAGWRHNMLIQLMIRFFRLTANIEARELADWPTLLAESGLHCRDRQLQVGGLVSAEVWTVQ